MNLRAIKQHSYDALLWLIVCTQIAFFPVTANAQTTDPTAQQNTATTQPAAQTQSAPAQTSSPTTTTTPTTPTSPTAPTAPGSPTAQQSTQQNKPATPKQPTGSSYTYNPDTGLWENDNYTWNPKTGQTAPKAAAQPQYSYNPSTEHWDTPEYAYDPSTGNYEKNTHAAAQAAAPKTTISNTGPNSTNTIQSSDGPVNASIDKTGPNSTTTIASNEDNSATFDLFFDASISQDINATSTSGNASVLQNTNGGNAITGDATAVANILNMLQSSFGLSPAQIATFNANIDGDVVGDLTVDPGQLQPKVSANSGAQNYDNLLVNSEVNGQINNDVNLSATSGDATVAGNTKGGNATTGNATAIANVINMINSAISAGQSFVGSININGNLNGDILLPSWMQNQLIAAAQQQNGLDATVENTGPNSSNTIDVTDDSSYVADFNDTIAINNNITANSTTGNAAVTNNTKGGNATTGNAQSNVNIINLTGKQVVGANSLLVFVNVLGKWVGVIMDAPAGVTSGVVGNGITQNTTLAKNTEVNSTTNMEINNNITINAESGDATVDSNTEGGNATTGNATTGVNVANIANSQFSLTGWFGVLFINVFGSWEGSFGVDTAAGNKPMPQQPGRGGGASSNGSSQPSVAGQSGQVASANSSRPITNPGVFGFIPTFTASASNDDATDAPQNEEEAKTLATTQEDTPGQTTASAASTTKDLIEPSAQWTAPIITALGMGIIIVLIDRRWGIITGNK